MPKHFLQSKTFWASIGTIVAAIGAILTAPHLTPDVMITSAISVLTAIAAIMGRSVAQGPLTTQWNPPPPVQEQHRAKGDPGSISLN